MKVLLNDMEKVQEFVSIVSHSTCDVDLISGKSTYLDAKSILGIISCNINEPLTVEIFGNEDERKELIRGIKKFIIEKADV